MTLSDENKKNPTIEWALPTSDEKSAVTELEQLLAQHSQIALEGAISDKDIDTVFGEELESYC